MTKDNKYYTPEIEEFHVGFEYYLIDNNGNPTEKKEVFNKNLMLLFTKETLVKYLDRDDIESLGWEHDQTTKDGAVFYIGHLMSEKQWMLTAENARKGNDYTKISIIEVNNSVFENSFSGTVKNKSELRRLMKQLGINEQHQNRNNR